MSFVFGEVDSRRAGGVRPLISSSTSVSAGDSITTDPVEVPYEGVALGFNWLSNMASGWRVDVEYLSPAGDVIRTDERIYVGTDRELVLPYRLRHGRFRLVLHNDHASSNVSVSSVTASAPVTVPRLTRLSYREVTVPAGDHLQNEDLHLGPLPNLDHAAHNTSMLVDRYVDLVVGVECDTTPTEGWELSLAWGGIYTRDGGDRRGRTLTTNLHLSGSVALSSADIRASTDFLDVQGDLLFMRLANNDPDPRDFRVFVFGRS